MASKTVKLPVFGQVNKGTAAGVTIGGFAVAGYLIYRRQKQAKQQAAASQMAEATASTAYGYGAYTSNGYYGYGEFAPYGYGASGGFFPGYYGYGTPSSGGPVPNTTNAQWSQAAAAQLTSEGYDGQTVLAALGAYITGNNVTATQVPIVQAAIALEGYPPQPGASGYPPAIKTGGTPGGGQGGGNTVAVPNVVGDGLGAAKKAIAAAGLKHTWVGNPAKPMQVVKAENPPAATQVAPGSSVALTVGKKTLGSSGLPQPIGPAFRQP